MLLPFNYTNPSTSFLYFFLTIHLFYSTNPPPPLSRPPLHLYTEPRLMSSTEVKTYRQKERQRTTKALIRLRGCVLLFIYNKTGFLEMWPIFRLIHVGRTSAILEGKAFVASNFTVKKQLSIYHSGDNVLPRIY